MSSQTILTQFFQPIPKQQWVADSSTNSCKQCNNVIKSQSLFSSGKHHCRCCGTIVCSKCSSNRIAQNRVCNTCFDKFQNRNSHYNEVIFEWNRIRPSNMQNDFCELKNNDNYNVCISRDRIFFILNHYHLWLQSNESMNEFYLDPAQFFSMLSNYNISSLWDDYHHIINFHDYKKEKCVLRNCVAIKRNMRESKDFARNIDETRKLYRINNDDNIRKDMKLISIQQLLDIIHCFIYHKEHGHIHNNDKFVTELDNDDEKKQKNSINNSECIYGFGVEVNYWDKNHPNYCDPKYFDLKTELLFNNIYKLEIFEYESILNKAEQYQDTKKCKIMKARNAGYRNKMYGVKIKSIMSLNHLVSIMLYCNNNSLQRLFKKTYRISSHNNNSNNNNYNNIITKHCEVCNWARYIFESVVFYGKCVQQNDTYYHGINQPVMFGLFETEFFIPISTTTDVNIANKFSSKNGIIVEFTKTKSNTVRYLDVSHLSAFPQEKEKLFVYGFLQLYNIWYHSISMKKYIASLKLFDRIIKGSYFAFDKTLCCNDNQRTLTALINYIINNDNNNSKRIGTIPPYIIDLFRFKVRKTKAFYVNQSELKSLNHILRDLLHKSFIPYVCDNNNNIIVCDIAKTSWVINNEQLEPFWNSDNKHCQIKGDTFVHSQTNDEQKVDIVFNPICSRNSDIYKNDGYFCFGFDIEYQSNLLKGIEYEFDIFIANNSFYTAASAVCMRKKGVRIPYLFPSKVLPKLTAINISYCIRIIDTYYVDPEIQISDTQQTNDIVNAYYG